MNKCGRLAAVLCLSAIFLAGCGTQEIPSVIDAPTVSVSEDGQITSWLVGVFDEEYYVLSELSEMAMSEAAQFNESRSESASEQGGANAVVVESVAALQDGSDKVVVMYRFDNWESYTEFSEDNLFYGTVAEAAQNGYSTQVVLKNVNDGTEVQLGQLAESHLIITDAKVTVYCPDKVMYVSEGAVLNENGSVDASGVEGLVYILLK